MEKPQSNISFKIMASMFKIRDFIRPRSTILREVGIERGFHVLDFGCGPGGYIGPLAKLLCDTGKIYALDTNPLAINYVKTIVAKKKLTNVELIQSDGITGLPDSSLDVILLYDVFHILSDPEVVLREFHRILKKSSTLSVTDHHLQDIEIISAISGTHLFELSKRGEKILNFSRV